MGEEKGLWEYKKSETSHLEQQHKGQKQWTKL
jgi:hypothetical protein